MFYVFASLLCVLAVILWSVFLAPLSASYPYPLAMLFFVLGYVTTVSLVNFRRMGLSILAVPFGVLREMLESVFPLVSGSFYGVFNWHTSYCATTANLRQMNLEAY